MKHWLPIPASAAQLPKSSMNVSCSPIWIWKKLLFASRNGDERTASAIFYILPSAEQKHPAIPSKNILPIWNGMAFCYGQEKRIRHLKTCSKTLNTLPEKATSIKSKNPTSIWQLPMPGVATSKKAEEYFIKVLASPLQISANAARSSPTVGTSKTPCSPWPKTHDASPQVMELVQDALKNLTNKSPISARNLRKYASAVPFAPPKLHIQALGKMQVCLNEKIITNT